MKVVVLAVAIVALSALLRADCPNVDLDQQFASADAVFVGRVIGQEVVNSPRRPKPHDRMTETTFTVEDLWKGNGTTVRVRTCSWSVEGVNLTCSEDFHFQIRDTYIVFASGTPLETSGCSATARLDKAETVLKWLAGKPHHKIG